MIEGSDGNFYGTTHQGGANFVGTAYQLKPSMTTPWPLTTLLAFDGTDGSMPAGVIEGNDGNFYGIATNGGAKSDGTVFQLTPSATALWPLSTFYTFCSVVDPMTSYCLDGITPVGLIQASDSNFYGATSGGGTNIFGTVFKLTTSGTLTTIYSSCSETNCTDGESPGAGVIRGSDTTSMEPLSTVARVTTAPCSSSRLPAV